MLYDAFICHASEDKDDFVRPLAELLREEHIEVWYDEFSLKLGDSLRRSIDLGLSQSRFGIVVFSTDFFKKQWSQWELDGLVARQNSDASNVILPIWRDVTREDILAYSPSLADKFAISSDAGIAEVLRRLTQVIRPQGSTLVTARDHLLAWGCNPPVVTDDWWLDVAAAAESNNMEGTFQEPIGWGRWGFPLPEASRDSEERGWRMAWAAAQMGWQLEAERLPITQITHPDVVAEFIATNPGLAEMCETFPRYMISYAPQLAIRGFGGKYEDVIESLYLSSCARAKELRDTDTRYGTALTVDQRPPSCDDEYALRDLRFGGYNAAHVACGFVQGNYVANGPPVRYYSHIDYLAWLLSDASSWLPGEIRDYLTKGMAEWDPWIWDTRDATAERDFGFVHREFSGAFGDALMEARDVRALKPTAKVRRDLVHRLDFSATLLSLPETGEELAALVLADDFLDAYFHGRSVREARASKRAKKAAGAE